MSEGEQATAAAAAPPPPHASASASASKNVVHWQEVQDTVSRIASHKGVLAVSILNAGGDIVTQQVTEAGAARGASLSGGERTAGASGAGYGGPSGGGSLPAVLGNPLELARMMEAAGAYVASLSGRTGEREHSDGSGESPGDGAGEDAEAISFVRIRTPSDEVLVAPKLGYTLVVLQDPSLSSL